MAGWKGKTYLFGLLVLFWTGQSVHAQSLCGIGAVIPPSGQLCVLVSANSSTMTEEFIGPSPLTFMASVGDYTVSMTATYVVSAVGVEVNLAGIAQRVADSGNAMANIIVEVEGGRSGPLPQGNGALSLTGSTTGVGQVIQGGAAGYSVLNGQDLQFDGFNQVLTANLFGPGDFALADPQTEIVEAGAIAVKSITTFQLNEVNEIIDIPSGTGSGEVFPAGSDGREIVIRAPVEGNEDGEGTSDLDRLEHWPIEKLFIFTGPGDCDDVSHYHVERLLANAVQSLESSKLSFDPKCGLGKTENTPVQTVATMNNAITIDENYNIPAGEGIFVAPSGVLTIPEGVTMTVNRGASLAVQGSLVVNGTLVIGEGSRVDIDGEVRNTGNTIENSGTLNIWDSGSLDNSGSFTNLITGTIQNIGGIANTGVLCNDGTILGGGGITDNTLESNCDLFFDASFD